MKIPKLNRNTKGIVRVSAANMISLVVSLVTSFVLPYFISVKEYGYWQLFVLYSGYAGFFAFGFNDGIHLNYANSSYDNRYFGKFSAFNRLLFLLTTVETASILAVVFLFRNLLGEKYLLIIFSVLSIIPTIIGGMFTYMNQSMLRFKEYSIGTIIDKVSFVIVMVILLLCKVRNGVYFICAYTICRYIVILYHFTTSKEVFFSKPSRFSDIKLEVIRNFKSGIALMIATILNGSIIVGSRLIVESRFGVEDFSAYSFSIHTLVVASQFISAISAVFYPIMKRCHVSKLYDEYKTFDEISALICGLLLLSYYPASLCVFVLYKKYASILTYLTFVYPLFIFQCKSNLLIINTYKVVAKPIKLILRNAIGIVLNIVFAFLAYVLFGTVSSVAVSVLISYAIWYYISQIILFHEMKWILQMHLLFDLLFIAVFLLCNVLIINFVESRINQILFGFGAYTLCLFILLSVFWEKVKRVISTTMYYLN